MEGFPELQDGTLTWAVPVLAGGLSTWASPKGCLSVLTTWRLASPQAGDLGENKEEALPFYGRTLKVTLCHFCDILLVTRL